MKNTKDNSHANWTKNFIKSSKLELHNFPQKIIAVSLRIREKTKIEIAVECNESFNNFFFFYSNVNIY
jgi:hypothetical protein